MEAIHIHIIAVYIYIYIYIYIYFSLSAVGMHARARTSERGKERQSCRGDSGNGEGAIEVCPWNYQKMVLDP